MANILPETFTQEKIDISHIITEDDTPVDNIFSEKQQRLLAESLNSNWKPGKLFLASSNVGIFYAVHQPPIVPDMFLSMDVQAAEDLWEKKNRSYFVWEFGKPPEVVVEIVSNKKGEEAGSKLRLYEKIRILYYIIFDPQKLIQKEKLRIYEFSSKGYIPKIGGNLSQVGLGVTLWDGIFEGSRSRWLRWCDNNGNLILTGAEQSELERQNAEKERQNAERERQNAERERQNAERERQRAEAAEKKLNLAEKEAVYSKAMETARKMLAKGYRLNEIMEITGLPADEIKTFDCRSPISFP